MQQLTDYFADLLESHSWSTVKHDLYGLRLFAPQQQTPDKTDPVAASADTRP